jgi:uncharacterized membrane protein
MTSALRTDWKIPLALLGASAIPCAAGMARLHGLASHSALNGDSERFFSAPLAVTLHILGASLFSLLGALQFSTGWRLRHPQWHRVCGRVVAASGVLAALSGMWLTVRLPIPAALQGELLLGVRLLVGAAMLVSIVLAVGAALQRDLARHRAWMIRGYALGLGAGMQVVLLLPWMLLMGQPGALQRDLLMSLAWLLNLLIAERVIRTCALPPLRFFIPVRAP